MRLLATAALFADCIVPDACSITRSSRQRTASSSEIRKPIRASL